MNKGVLRTLVFSCMVIMALFGGVYIRAARATPGLFSDKLTIKVTPGSYKFKGDVLNFSYKYYNAFSNEVINVSFTDSFGSVSCSSTSALEGHFIECFRQVQVTDQDVLNGKIENTVTVTGEKTASNSCGGSSQPGCGSSAAQASLGSSGLLNTMFTDSSSITVKAVPLKKVLNMTVAGNPAAFTDSGQSIAYTYTLSNAGEVPLNGPFSVDDTLARVSCPAVDTLGLNATLICTATYKTTAADVLAGAVNGWAIAHARFNAGTIIEFINSNSLSTSFPLTPQPALTVTKSANPPCFSWTGQSINYTYMLSNVGNVPLVGPFVIMDNFLLDGSIFCPNAVSLGVGGSLTCTGAYTVVARDLGKPLETSASAAGQFEGEQVVSAPVPLKICYNKYIPVVTPAPPTPAPPSPKSCADYVDADSCNADSACVWNGDFAYCQDIGN